MKDYLQNLLPHVREYSQSLDKQELFVDKPWVILDENNNQQKYIFRRNGELIMSLNGQVSTGRWEYISAAKSLLINRIKDKILLNQDFFDPAVMILKMDGNKEKPFLMANEQLIPDLNIENHLRRVFFEKNNIRLLQLSNGASLELHDNLRETFGTVTINAQPVADGVIQGVNGLKKYVVRDSRIVKVLTKQKYKTNNGVIEIENEELLLEEIGNSVFKDNQPAPDGKYRISALKKIYVQKGKIVKISMF